MSSNRNSSSPSWPASVFRPSSAPPPAADASSAA
eukprot:CAMPEP_0175114842 /NCGR_PEP_ID=MMETSP0086_2-20121207/17142_1 /TAXON_ID=136419 /ORGANISM="Unknown Unknown, Strain D1" /LENGTH=33 /DNA_ID= /DNA_START= /DNA_END= /DNA_ORIENTATION=